MGVIRPKAYLAAPLFNPQEREFNVELANRLSSILEVFLPQRDGELLTKLVSQGHFVEASQKRIYAKDTAAIDVCEIVVAVLDGRTVDEGVAYELGYAGALGKTCIGFKSDDRGMLPTGDNPMIICGCDHHVSTVDELIERIRSWLAARSETKLDQFESVSISDPNTSRPLKRD